MKQIKHENGIVTFEMRTGADLVRSKMPIASAHGIVNRGNELVEIDGKLIVDDTYFFPIENLPKSRKAKKEDVV